MLIVRLVGDIITVINTQETGCKKLGAFRGWVHHKIQKHNIYSKNHVDTIQKYQKHKN